MSARRAARRPSLAAAEQFGHRSLVGNGAAGPSSGFPCLVLGDGGVDLGLLDLCGGGAVPEGCEHAVLVQGDHHGGLAAEMDHVVTVTVLCWPCAHEHDANPGTLSGAIVRAVGE